MQYFAGVQIANARSDGLIKQCDFDWSGSFGKSSAPFGGSDVQCVGPKSGAQGGIFAGIQE
jgi:hypothetical protein